MKPGIKPRKPFVVPARFMITRSRAARYQPQW